MFKKQTLFKLGMGGFPLSLHNNAPLPPCRLAEVRRADLRDSLYPLLQSLDMCPGIDFVGNPGSGNSRDEGSLICSNQHNPHLNNDSPLFTITKGSSKLVRRGLLYPIRNTSSIIIVIVIIMSSWERSRFLPWSRIPEDPNNLTEQKERIFRQLQREADRQQREREEQRQQKPKDGSNATADASSKSLQTGIMFQWSDLFKSAAFGGCIGAMTGSVFGFMDSMRLAGQSEVLKNASDMAKGKYMMEGTTRSATLFGLFFSGFHVVKYGIRVALDPGEYTEIAMAGGVSLGAILSKPSFRPAMPYASMLILMDIIHLVMRQFESN
jgi:hypothetical protein